MCAAGSPTCWRCGCGLAPDVADNAEKNIAESNDEHRDFLKDDNGGGSAEEQDKGGSLVISDHRFNANRGYKDEYNKWFEPHTIIPCTGDVVLFPSFLYHNVETFYGKLRLAMPVDLILYDNE